METRVDQRVAIIEAARSNDAFRREIITGQHAQVVVMTIPPGGEIGSEVHAETDQLFLVVDGEADVLLGLETSHLRPNDLLLVPAGTGHNVVSIGPRWLRLITMYAPPQHRPGTVHQTKEEADAAELAVAAPE